MIGTSVQPRRVTYCGLRGACAGFKGGAGQMQPLVGGAIVLCQLAPAAKGIV